VPRPGKATNGRKWPQEKAGNVRCLAAMRGKAVMLRNHSTEGPWGVDLSQYV
jgi:hypothetical protein